MFLLSNSAAFAAGFKEYKVKPQDVLSTILRKNHLKPLYGVNGSLEKTLKLNQHIKRKGDLIFPGQIILLPIEEESQSVEESELAVVASENDTFEVEPVLALLEKDEARALANDPTAEQKGSTSLTVSPTLDFFKIDSTDKTTHGKSHVLSDAAPGLEARWNIDWNEKVVSWVQANYQSYHFQDLPNGKSFDHTRGSRAGVGFFTAFELSPKLTLGGGLALHQILFVYGKSLSEVGVDKVLTPTPKIFARYDLLQREKASFGVLGEASALIGSSSSNVTTKTGHGFTTGTYLKYGTQAKSLSADLTYAHQSQDTNLTNQVFSNVGLKLSYQWALDL